ncbi:MAG: bifunctional (p)ppGpp synthetase/guanosine-3',5'-bis(diphosphate) 3'-pyrophosphohydrolase [Ignavibacteriae bacterium]|nr:bifunctional (p)ppGpp synthetase/guanosine-3',5'-bis(diphosphate) 3'-pyrophosphohydrolase [Ignavibacteriota bacterium]
MKSGVYKRQKLDELLELCKTNLRTVNEDLIRHAYEFSSNAHDGVVRDSGEPYFDHPYSVAKVVAQEFPLDDVSVACALLHDVVEDTKYEIKDIKAEFGATIANIVDGTTKITDVTRDHQVTQAESYRKLLLSMVTDIRVMLIKFADRLHNMRTLEHVKQEKRPRIAKETLDIYAPFAHRFGLAKVKWELEDAAFKYLHPTEYEEIVRKLKATKKELDAYIKEFIKPLKVRLDEAGFTYEIEGRPKHPYSIYNKMRAREKPFEEIYDLFAIRIILESENDNDCFLVYGIVSSAYTPNSERFKNYVSVPKKNGYQSLHTTVVGPDGRMIEVQIRTPEMHEIAEKGVAAHWKYKENIAQVDEELEHWVQWVRDLFEHGDQVSVEQLMESFKLTLYQDEIYVFTPKGDLKTLPVGATTIDFAFAVHSNVGFHCIGAKVNGKIVTLDTTLQSGDQVEILTSKKQTPNMDWEQIATTHKAKSHIRRWFKDEERKALSDGREQLEKRLKKQKVHLNEEDIVKYLSSFGVTTLRDFYLKIHKGEIDADSAINTIHLQVKHIQPEEKKEEEAPAGFIDRFIQTARKVTGGISLRGSQDSFLHSYAKCCNPIPGDPIIGFVSQGDGIKVHRANCKNIQELMLTDKNRIIEVSWPQIEGTEFSAAIRIAGEDRTGMLNDITHSISTYQNTNIRGVNIDTQDRLFEGYILVYVKDKEHLNRLTERLRKIKGVSSAERYSESLKKHEK